MKKNKTTNKSQIKYIIHFIFKSLFLAIACILIGFVVLVAIYLGDLLLNSDKKDSKPLFSTYVILTPSMVPTININDAIVVKREDNDNYKVGDVITFTSKDINYDGLAVTHRIVEKHKIDENISSYTTKGDNNTIVDPTPVKTDAIYGKVLLRIPKVGYLKRYFSNPINYLLCILVPTAIYIIYNFIKILIAMKKKEKKSI